jgi:hypothetical protein
MIDDETIAEQIRNMRIDPAKVGKRLFYYKGSLV